MTGAEQAAIDSLWGGGRPERVVADRDLFASGRAKCANLSSEFRVELRDRACCARRPTDSVPWD